MVNAGVKVFLTTHSDYLIKEFNTLIMLAQKTSHTKSVQSSRKYDDNELLNPKRIRLYMTGIKTNPKTSGAKSTKVNTLLPAMKTAEYGIEVTTFDKSIEDMNAIQNEILYGGDL